MKVRRQSEIARLAGAARWIRIARSGSPGRAFVIYGTGPATIFNTVVRREPPSDTQRILRMETFIFESDAGPNGCDRWTAELRSVREAQIQAVKTLGELLSHDGSEFWKDEPVTMTVSDGSGLVLFRLDLSALKVAAMGSSGLGHQDREPESNLADLEDG